MQRHDAQLPGTMRIVWRRYRALRVKKGGWVGVLRIKKGELRIEKKGHHTSCTVLAFTSCHGVSRWQSAQQLCGRKKQN